MPLDAHPEKRFVFIYPAPHDRVELRDTWQTQFASCPQAAEFRCGKAGVMTPEPESKLLVTKPCALRGKAILVQAYQGSTVSSEYVGKDGQCWDSNKQRRTRRRRGDARRLPLRDQWRLLIVALAEKSAKNATNSVFGNHTGILQPNAPRRICSARKLLVVAALLIQSALLAIVTESPGIAAPSTVFDKAFRRVGRSDALIGASRSIHFSTLPPHATLPSEATCAQSVPKSSWEPRPENATANHQKPTLAELAAFYANPLNFIDGPPTSDFQAVDGNYTGTTDMIIRWAACKWGLDENVLRAQAFEESTWSAYTTGDLTTSPLSCAAGLWDGWQTAGYCYQSYGITQMKMMSFNAWPAAWNSTSFNLDFRGAYWRACMNGDVSYYYDQIPTSGYPTYPNGNTSQMLWGCIGSWFSGSWYDSAALSYISGIQTLNNSKTWQALPSGTSLSLRLLSPTSGSTISGAATINISLDQNDPKACYACLSIDGVFQRCTPAVGPWTWNTNNYVLNGHHAIQVDAYTCNGAGPNYHVGEIVTVAN